MNARVRIIASLVLAFTLGGCGDSSGEYGSFGRTFHNPYGAEHGTMTLSGSHFEISIPVAGGPFEDFTPCVYKGETNSSDKTASVTEQSLGNPDCADFSAGSCTYTDTFAVFEIICHGTWLNAPFTFDMPYQVDQ